MGSGKVGIPPPPPGFVPVQEPQEIPPPPPGFVPVQESAAAPSAPQGSALSRFASNAWEQVNPIETAKGVVSMLGGPIRGGIALAKGRPEEAYQEMAGPAKAIFDPQKALFDEGMAAARAGDRETALQKLSHAIIPALGPQLDKAWEQRQSGDVAGALGTASGIAANVAGPKLLGLGKGRFAGPKGVYRRALNPAKGSFTPKEIKAMVNEGITEGYVISEEGLTKIRQGINDLDDAISAQIDSTGQNKIIDTGKATAALDAEKAKLGKFASRADIDAVEAARADFTDRIQRSRAANEGKISAADAQELKRTYGREIGDAWKTNDTPATIDAKKAIYSAFREELEAQFPEIGGLNAKQSARINLEKAGRAAVEKAANKTVIPYRAGIVGGGLQILTGDPGIAGTAALMAEAMKYPGFSSRLAIAISRGSGGKVSAVMARARVGEWTRALGQAVEDAESGDGQATQQAP